MFSSRENQEYYEFDSVFTREWVSPTDLSCFTDSLQNIHRLALLFIDNKLFVAFLHKQTEKNLQRWTYSHLLCLDETSSVAYNSCETLTCNQAYYFFFTFPVVMFWRDTIWRTPRKRVAKRRETLKSWNAVISKYIQLQYSVFAVLEKSCYSSTYVKLEVK